MQEKNHYGIVRTYTYRDGNTASLGVDLTKQQLTIDGTAPTHAYAAHDGAHGNQTDIGTTIDLNYDDLNRLTTWTDTATTITYTWNPDGLITKRVKNGVTTDYWYDPQGRLIREKTGTSTTTYTHNQTGIETITLPTGTVYHYHHNTRGDVLRLTDASRNTKVTYRYTAYGECIAIDASDGSKTPCAKTGGAGSNAALIAANRYTYNGAMGVQLDGDTGLYWMGARYYDAKQGRFLQVDPVEAASGSPEGPYSYGANDPVNNVDSDGRWWTRSEFLQKIHYQEFRWCANHFGRGCGAVSYATARAIWWTREIMGVGYRDAWRANGGRVDAFRHAMWNALMFKWLMVSGYDLKEGDNLAAGFSRAHESGCVSRCGRSGDFRNNRLGRSVFLEGYYLEYFGYRSSVWSAWFVSERWMANRVRHYLNTGALNTTGN